MTNAITCALRFVPTIRPCPVSLGTHDYTRMRLNMLIVRLFECCRRRSWAELRLYSMLVLVVGIRAFFANPIVSQFVNANRRRRCSGIGVRITMSSSFNL